MKKLLTILSLCGAAAYANAQKADSTIMGAGYANNIFYSMQNGTVHSSSNTQWHIAFSVQPAQPPSNTLQATTIRVNSVRNFIVYRVPGKKIADFSTVDTTGITTWTPLSDSDTSWDYGALNAGLDLSKLPPNGPDYGWGSYNAFSFNVETDSSVFIMKGPGFFRKFYIEKLSFDTTWYFTHAKLDNDSLTNVSLNKQNYTNRLFMYYSFTNAAFSDLEPAKNTWDIVFTRYIGISNGQPFPVTGIFQNKGVTAVKAAKVDVNTVSEATYSNQYKTAINTIGYDWKTFDNVNFTYFIEDSTVYYVKTGNKKYKMVFTAFDLSNGKSVFNTQQVFGLSVNDISEDLHAEVYPNPASSYIHIETPFVSSPTSVSLYNLNGQALKQTSITGSGNLDLAGLGLKSGLYLLRLENGGNVKNVKIAIQ